MSQKIWSQLDLVKLAEHKKAEVRRWTCERMRILYGEAGTGILERLLKDRDKNVLLEALEYLENYLNPKFDLDLLNLYESRDGIIAGKSALLLGKLKNERLISIFKKKRHSRTVEFDETFWVIRAMGELATHEAKVILREMLSGAGEGTDPFLINTLIYALMVAQEDLHGILKYYSYLYKNFAAEILHPFTSVCGSWYSLEDLKVERKKKLFKKGVPPVVTDSLAYLREKGFDSLEKEIYQSFKKQNYSRTIEIAWQQVEELVNQKSIDFGEPMLGGDSPPLRNYQVLKTFKDYLSWGPEDSLRWMAIVALIVLSKFIEFKNLLGLKTEDLNEEVLLQILFEDRNGLKVDDQLIERLLIAVPPETIFNRSVRQLEEDPYSFGAERALGILGRLKEEKAIPYLVDHLDRKASDTTLDESIKALVQMGSPLIDYLNKNFDQLNQDQQFEALYALKDLPEEGVADILLHNWDKLWDIDKESFLYALEGVASKRFIDPLRKELKEDEELEEEVFYLLCHIHGVDDLLLPKIEKVMREREKETEKRVSVLEGDDLRPLMERTVRVELKCRQCGKSYHYEVENIYMIPKEKGKPRISDKIVCKNCRAVNQYEITAKGDLAITSQMILMTALAEKGKLRPEESPIKFGESGLMDGRRMSFDEVLNYYKEGIKKSPHDPGLRIGYGNVLMKTGREVEATLHYKEALRLDPLAVEAYCTLGEYEGDKGNLSRAYEYFKKAYDHLHSGHYYRTKEPDQLKEAILFNFEHFGKMLGKEREEIRGPSSQEIVKRDKVGRNDPCPCGSGKKYKKCCLNKDEARRSEKTSATPKEIELRDKLLSFSGKERYQKDFERAYHLFYRKPFSEPLTMEEKEETDFAFFLEWFIHDFPLKSGLTVVEEFYKEKREKFSDEERFLTEYEMASILSLYEVISVTPEIGLRLRDLFTGEEMDILEVKGSLTAVRWDVIFARVIRMDSVNKLAGLVKLVPRRNKDLILSSIRNLWEKFKEETGKVEWYSFAKSNAFLIHHIIEDQSPFEPVFVTEEYHRIISSKAVFDAKDFQMVRYRLNQEFDFIIDQEEDWGKNQWTWLKRGRSKDWEIKESQEGAVILKSEMLRGKGELRWTSLGTVTLTPKKLELWCISKERLDRGKIRLKEILGDDIQHRIDTYEDMIKKVKEEVRRGPSTDQDVMLEEFYPYFSKEMEEFVKKWMDEEIPALDGKTPREAVKTAEGKRKVEELLKDWENMEERRRREGEPYIDTDILRQMLNL
jgi:tetratricopeptide (TPR) repeat protein